MRALVGVTMGLIAILAAFPAAAGKIGVLDAERAAVTVREGKQGLKLLEEWANAQRARIEELRRRVSTVSEEYNRQRLVASGPALEQLESELVSAQRALEDAARDFNREVTTRKEKLLGDIAAKIGLVASDYAEANDFDVVLLVGAQPIAFYSKSVDITDTVIRLYDQRFPVK